jgi:hypothetical protein
MMRSIRAKQVVRVGDLNYKLHSDNSISVHKGRRELQRYQPGDDTHERMRGMFR